MLTMLLLLSSGQGPTPCGGKFNPCYVKADQPLSVRWEQNDAGASLVVPEAGGRIDFRWSTPGWVPIVEMTNADELRVCRSNLKAANEATEHENKMARLFFQWSLMATVIALIGWFGALSNWKNIFAAWKQSELSFTVPLEVRQAFVLLACPFVAGVVGGLFMKTVAMFANEPAGWFYWGAMGVAAFLGGSFGLDWATQLESRSQLK